MKRFKYSFFSSTARRSKFHLRGTEMAGGADRIIFDTEDLIASRMGFAPAYPQNDKKALADKDCLIVAVTSALDNTQTDPFHQILANADERWVGVYLQNTRGNGMQNSLQYDFILSPTFLPFNPVLSDVPLKPSVRILPIHIFPSRATPEAIARAARSYTARMSKERRAAFEPPITTIVIGELASYTWNPRASVLWSTTEKEVRKLKRLMKIRGGSILLTTSARTSEDTRRHLDEALHPWYAERYVWAAKRNKENPYLAYLGLADEIIVSGESLSMMSDAVMTGKPMRLLHGWPADYLARNGLSHAPKMVEGLIRRGVKANLERPRITPPPILPTGLDRAARSICAGIRRRAAQLGL